MNKFDKIKKEQEVAVSKLQEQRGGINSISDEVKESLSVLLSWPQPNVLSSTDAERVAYLTSLEIKSKVERYLNGN